LHNQRKGGKESALFYLNVGRGTYFLGGSGLAEEGRDEAAILPAGAVMSLLYVTGESRDSRTWGAVVENIFQNITQTM